MQQQFGEWLAPLLSALLIFPILGGLAWILRRSKPLAVDKAGGTIAPDKASAWFTIVGGVTMAVASGAFAFHNGRWPEILLALVGAAAAGFMAPSLTTLHVVHWTATSIEGPSRLFGPTLGIARTDIAWSELVKTGKTITGYWFVEATDGRRIYWSYLYKGHGLLTHALAANCPNLGLPEDMK